MIIAIITGFIFLSITLYFLFFARITEKTYNEVICYYVARKVTQNAKGFEEKIRALRDFIHKNIHPLGGTYIRSGNTAAETLIYGIGWCDQQARVFIQLAHRIGIRARLLHLRSGFNTSPHSVAEALAPDNRWIIVDPLFNLELLNKDGAFASQSDVKNDPDIITKNRRVQSRSGYDPKWSDPKLLAIYYNTPRYVLTKKGRKFDFFKFLPLSRIRPIANIIQNRYLKQIVRDTKNIYKLKMLQARGYHLLGYYEKSGNLYRDIIKNSNHLLLKYKAEYFYSLLLKDKGMYQEADSYISEIIVKEAGTNNPYLPYLQGLRARVLKKMCKYKEAEEILKELQYSLDI